MALRPPGEIITASEFTALAQHLRGKYGLTSALVAQVLGGATGQRTRQDIARVLIGWLRKLPRAPGT